MNIPPLSFTGGDCRGQLRILLSNMKGGGLFLGFAGAGSWRNSQALHDMILDPAEILRGNHAAQHDNIWSKPRLYIS